MQRIEKPDSGPGVTRFSGALCLTPKRVPKSDCLGAMIVGFAAESTPPGMVTAMESPQSAEIDGGFA